MTGRERITAAARGGEVDQRPSISAFGAGPADAIAVSPTDLALAIDANPASAVLATVLSPLGRAIERDLHIMNELHGDVDKGNRLLTQLVDETHREMHSSLEHGADGVFYVLDGAHPGVTTPMEYGGHFLEVDRHLLNSVIDARFNLLYVRGGSEPYIDFVSDLPAHAFGWDPRSGVTVAQVREMRQGALAAADQGAEIELRVPSEARV